MRLFLWFSNTMEFYLRMTFCHFYWWLWARIPHNPGIQKKNVECKWAVWKIVDSVITCLCVLCEFPWKSHGWRIIVVTNGWATTPQQLELQNNEQLFRFCWRKEWIIEFSPLFSLCKKLPKRCFTPDSKAKKRQQEMMLQIKKCSLHPVLWKIHP